VTSLPQPENSPETPQEIGAIYPSNTRKNIKYLMEKNIYEIASSKDTIHEKIETEIKILIANYKLRITNIVRNV
jgi:hypothetical protein